MESSNLPSDMIYEILSRASNNTLARCKVASKKWNQMTYDSKFIKLHSQMNNIVDGFWAQHDNLDYSFVSISDGANEINLDFLQDLRASLKAISAKDGIILCESDHQRVVRYFVCKPRIKSYQQIPNPRTKLWTEKVAISVIRSNPFRYKILRISSSKENFVKNYQRLYGEVFDSETWTWKRLKHIMLPNHLMFKGCEPAVTVCGAFHWLMHNNLIFSFDVEEEEWTIHRLPVKEDDYDSINLAEYKGKLAMTCMDSEGYMETWVLENYKNKVWKNKFGRNIKECDSGDMKYTPMAFYGSDIVVVSKKNVISWHFGFSLMYFDFKNGKVLKEEKLERGILPNGLLPFWSDSEPCCLRGNQ